MKLFPTDWGGFLDVLVSWGDLSIPARKAFLDGIAPGLSVEPAHADPAIEELCDARFLEEQGGTGRFTMGESYVPFHQVMKSLQRFPLFESPGLALLCAYLSEHYSPVERSHLHESLALLPNDMPRIAGFVSSVEWLQNALSRAPRAGEAREMETARRMLGFFTEQRDRIALREVEEYFPGASREDICDGLRQGCQRAVFFLGLRRTDFEPLVGIWPAAARRLRRLSVVLAPEPVSPAGTFFHPFLIEDMTSILVAALVQPIPLRRGDDKPFARYMEDTAAMLLTLPEWLEATTRLSLEGRIGLALQACRITGLLVAADAANGSAPLTPSAESRAWIRRPLTDRRRVVAAVMAGVQGRKPRLFDLLEEEWTAAEGARESILPWIEQAFSFVPVTGFVRFDDFAEYQAAIGSPLEASGFAPAAAEPGSLAPGIATEEAMEELWKSFLGIFLGRCLLSLGGAEAGVTAEGKSCFRMTDLGRVLLGIPRDGLPDPEVSAARDAELIVQPNFEVVFLAPAPGVEAELGRFCERIGRDVGVLFRITRASIQRAALAGLEPGQVLDSLGRCAKSPLPANIVHEIRGWMCPQQP